MDNSQNQNPTQLPPTPMQPMPPMQPVVPQQYAQPQMPQMPKVSLFRRLTGSSMKGKLSSLIGVFILAGGGSLVATHGSKIPFLNHTTTPATTTTSVTQKTFSQGYLNSYQVPLETFYAGNKYYPSDITQPTLSKLNIPISQEAVNPPSGASYSYAATPTGCTTLAKNCTGYTMSVVDNNTGKAIATVQSSAGQL